MIRFGPCQCDAMCVARVQRSWWMRLLLPRMRYWVCTSCGRRFLASKERMAGVQKDSGFSPTTR
ncbi:MAG TPA: hypothetical protein VEA40_09770 [Ramlibacter sp.]|nr:hypothetical protein [Ramlibacter sp.]